MPDDSTDGPPTAPHPASVRLPGDQRRRPTLHEVARRAGVSRSVASRVMNNASNVSPAKREAVERAASELGYVPNATARALATSRVGSVVLAVSGDDPSYFGDPFFSQVLVGVATVLEEAELDLTLMLASSTGGQARIDRLLRSHRTDGVMVMGLRRDEQLGRVAEATDLPVVFCGRPLAREPRWYVDVDNRGGARAAVEHLLASGRSRVAVITGPLDLEASVARLGGYTDALAVAGLSADRVEHGDFTHEGGAAAMARLMATHPDLDAVFVGSDSMAAGALRVLKAHGRSVPEDVAVVGFDDLDVAQQTDPALTTVSQPIRALGHEMATMLIRLIDGENPTPIVLPTQLVVRASAPSSGS